MGKERGGEKPRTGIQRRATRGGGVGSEHQRVLRQQAPNHFGKQGFRDQRAQGFHRVRRRQRATSEIRAIQPAGGAVGANRAPTFSRTLFELTGQRGAVNVHDLYGLTREPAKHARVACAAARTGVGQKATNLW